MSQRIQRRRRAGYRMPDDAVYVGRPTKWGNPFRADYVEYTPDAAVARYRIALLAGELDFTVDDVKQNLAGKDLCCWCRPSEPCHADVLLEVANS